MLEDNSIQGAQGILINITGSSSLSLHEVHEASSIIQKAAHENANIIFGAVMDEAMKESVKITVIAAGFREVSARKPVHRPSYLPKTWKAAREEQPEPRVEIPREIPREAPKEMPREVAREVVRPVVREVPPEASADDLDVPTFLRRQAQKA